MSVIQCVLFPVDLSLDYQALTVGVRKMFDRPGIELVMLHVIEATSRSSRGMDVARSMAQMEFLARKEFEFARVTRRVERGQPAECILDYARNRGVDLIVMPAGGPESFRRGAVGRVAEEVLRGAPCAVWMDWMTGSVECTRHICCAVGLDGADEAVVSRAGELAAEFDADLTIIHAVVPDSPMLLWWDADIVEQEVRIARMRVGELGEKFAPAANVHVEAGRVDWVISRTLRRLDAGLLVVAGHGEAIVAAANACPVWRIGARRQELAAFAATA